MNFLVTKKVRSSAESFLTLTALIGSIWAVMFLVLNQSRPLTKDFSISAALERPCSGVSFSVLSKLLWLKNSPHSVHSYGLSPV